MQAFIVRPFGNRTVLQKEKNGNIVSVQFDFDKVETDLIKPAMQRLNLAGGTTGEIFQAGDIREDMFSDLLLADVVIADITIYNANVFYELGIRHALRDKRTILIKCSGFDETPFDIIGYRYTTYSKDNPAEALDNLVRSLTETIESDRKDSPVFNVLPYLKPHDTEMYLALPKDFIDDVVSAGNTKEIGKLTLLASETESFTWTYPALRLIGEKLYALKAFEAAKTVWEKILDYKPSDIQANDRLSTIYQRLAEGQMKLSPDEGISLLTKSDRAIETLLDNLSLSSYSRAETYALKARNAKTRWLAAWQGFNGDELYKKALQSVHLTNAYANYEKGFYEDLANFYSGINALGLLKTIIFLAEKDLLTWELLFNSKEEADQKLKEHKTKFQRLIIIIEFSIDSAKRKLELKGETDCWLDITEADLTCLVSENPARVSNKYNRALENATGLNLDATVRQLKIYESLQINTDNIKAALDAINIQLTQDAKPVYTILFTGHMIDKSDRPEPRFPPSKEEPVREIIKEKILEIQNKKGADFSLTGIAGGACGGDILFHEVCMELNIPSKIYLVIPRQDFLVESVAFAGNDWIERFDKLMGTLPHTVLSDQKELPKWLRKKPGYSIWIRNNFWELNSALVNGSMNMTLIAVWDGKEEDGPGGTAGLLNEAKKTGIKTIEIPIN
jgi:hypothetical protein